MDKVDEKMKITNLIEEALKEVQLKKSYLIRPTNLSECIVYNYIEKPNQYGDLKEVSTKYTVLLNLYTKDKVERYREIVKKAMLDKGFKKITIPPPVYSSGIFNTAMQFKISLINTENGN